MNLTSNPNTMKTETIKNKADRVIKVTELKNIACLIAQAMIKEYGYYTCVINGQKVFVTN